jgi:hypothetical protein
MKNTPEATASDWRTIAAEIALHAWALHGQYARFSQVIEQAMQSVDAAATAREQARCVEIINAARPGLAFGTTSAQDIIKAITDPGV